MKPLPLLFLNIIFSELKFCHYGNIAKKKFDIYLSKILLKKY